ncbi:MAG: L-threonylcarbamoyladenylate synthase [Anaerolineales bacterium]|nr:L-threonylcarbamoyladenylate synthase [Anaerolineales bacterium]
MRKETRILPLDQSQALSTAAEIIQAGGVIAFPTDTVYGIGTCAFDKDAIEKLYQIKGRSQEKAIPILIADPSGLAGITPPPGEMVQAVMEKFWPGALTLILPLLPNLPINLSPTNTIGVRIPDHAGTRELLRHTGPLAVTSANLSGQESAQTAEEVLNNLGGKIELILDGGISPGGVASTVLDCTKKEPLILRSGPISLEEILVVLRS